MIPAATTNPSCSTPKLSAGTFAFDVDDEYVGRKLWFSMTVDRGGKSAVVKGGGGEVLLDFKLVKQL
jgi:hypothetical protein